MTNLTGLVLSVYLSRTLGAAGVGVLAYLVLLMTLAHAFGMVGTDTAVVYHTGKKKLPPDRVAGNALLLSVALGLLIAAALGICARGVPALSHDVRWVYLAAVLGVIPVMFPAQMSYHIVWGQDRIEVCNLLRIASAVAGLAINLVCVGLLGLGLDGAVIAIVVSNVVYLAVTLGAAWGLGPAVSFRLSLRCLRALLGYGVRCYAGAILAFLMLGLDQLMVYYLMDRPHYWLGLYSRALIVERAWIVIAYSAAIPLMGRNIRQNPEQIGQTTPKVCRLVLAFGAVIAVVCLVGAEAILLVFGREFVGAAAALRILLPGVMIMGIAKIAVPGLQALNRPGLVSVASVLAVAGNFGLNWWLIPRLGIEGAALATSICYAVYGGMIVAALAGITGTPWWHFVRLTRGDVAEVLQRLRWRRRHRGASEPDVG